LEECDWPVNGSESKSKLANFLSDAMAQILGQMGKTVFDPLSNSISPVGNQHSSRKQTQYERDQGVPREMNPVADRGWGGERERAQF